jgi:WhiB family transcriptional regulator, redox-sensing transcriptional regulator
MVRAELTWRSREFIPWSHEPGILTAMAKRTRIESALTLTPGLNDMLMDAACVGEDPDVFFPEGRERPVWEDIDRAKAICATCPVVDPCLAWALAMQIGSGIWGGRTEGERQRMQGRTGRRGSRSYLSVVSARAEDLSAGS